ncbi:toll/interleukin-1 receptor domain-containing protein [Acinetobacter sp. YH12142]|uniref:toll/interleukin-1 receptor domain-containing protein n=1 Tax=Acinetobacter sp. YH12142 TaxID=2601126 RepID=UPI0015D3BC8A|nr:toll/interleukin-1 receptor domain-containing protein [Acinetobacter sp. YH12142]
MAISLDTLSNISTRFSRSANSYNLNQRPRTAFLCHSHTDAQYIKGFIQLLKDENINVYVDWLDNSMPDSPNRETAVKIQQKIQEADYFFFLATPNSVKSRWCPWEIGYADGVKKYESIFVIPTQDRNGYYYGNEYLELYQRIDKSDHGPLGFWKPNATSGRYMSSL